MQSKTPKARIGNKECGLQPETPKRTLEKEVTRIMNSMRNGIYPSVRALK